MAGRIPQSFIDELLARLDVIDVVDSRVKLKKTGKNYSACCPFHNENTPSFTVSPDKQFYYCFGCGASGTALKFVMEYDGLSFPDAVEKLASQAGLEVPKEQISHDARQEQQHQGLFKRMEAASQYFEQMLRQHEQRGRAVDYLKNRGLSGKAAKFFGIGYAPPGWDGLQTELGTDKEALRELVTCGMLIEKEDGRTYDRFRDRIMFPIRDARGRFIAFGGRVLGDEKPKYLNSPETPIFQKGRELYGLYEARKIRQKLTRFIIVEGYMDVVALAEYGIHYAVATLGTATSEHHLRRLFKIVPEVIFCFDGDNAGRTAAARAMETVLPVLSDGVQARFLFLPDGEDPDTLVRKEGKDAFEERLNKSVHLPEFLFDFLKKQVDFDTLDGKARLDQLAAPLINKIPAGMLKKLMKKRLEDEIGMSSEALADMNNIPVPATVLDYDLPPEEPSINISDYLPNDESEQHPLAPSVYKSLVQIVRQPSLARQLELPNADPETEYERLLLEVIRKLKLAPQQGSVGLLIQWIGTPYQAELQQMAESGSDGHIPPSANDINDVLKRMGARHLDVELNKLKAKFERGEKLSTEERQRLQELKRQRHEMNKKRTNIYRR
ncbi:DNA primase [Thalassolituus oleivorans]|uniref:DNA primase n=1 Tax=Thalassolituus oleivorans TaxID=187493 RepID=UPI0023F326E4|nr:DNA primase [Thalassolituus oleivorans]